MLVVRTPLGFEATVQDIATIHFSLTKLRERDDYIIGLLKIRAYMAGSWYQVFLGTFNLSSSQSRKNTIKYVKEFLKGTALTGIDWDSLIEGFAAEVFRQYYEPARATRLTNMENTSIPYLLYPLLPERVPVLIYAPGGAGKSIFALYVAVLLQSGRDLGLNPRDPVNVLYVDWELDETLMSSRFSQLVIEGLDTKEPPLYLRASHTLSDELNNIISNVQENDVKLVVLDSAGMALGGDINDASTVIHLFQEVRKLTDLGVTVLILTHISKAHKEREDGALPIGSIFFENLSRMTWELKCSKMPGDPSTYMYALYCRKSNFGYAEPIVIKVAWEDGLAFIEPANAKDTAAMTGSTLKDITLELLLENGEMSVDALSKMLGASKQVVWNTLSDLKREGRVEHVARGKWRAVQ